MQTHSIDNFLSSGSGNIPEGPWVAAAIHSSSEVDACYINGFLMAAGRGVVPLSGGAPVKALRRSYNGSTPLGNLTLLQGPADNVVAPGEKLVIITFEACDDIETPGNRAPILRQAIVKTVGTSAANASLAFRLPTSGRSLVILDAVASLNDVTLVVTGIKYPFGDGRTISGGAHFIEGPPQLVVQATTLQTGPSATGTSQSKGIYLTEAFDELAVFVYQASGLSAGIQVNAEICGERIQ